MIRWCAIGDSFTYLNDHPDETNHYVTKGYLSRTLDSLRAHGLDAELTNIGINGSTTRDWLTAPLVPADFYTILLGTNDWHSGIPLGTEEDFTAARPGTILGNLSHLIGRIAERQRTGRYLAQRFAVVRLAVLGGQQLCQLLLVFVDLVRNPVTDFRPLKYRHRRQGRRRFFCRLQGRVGVFWRPQRNAPQHLAAARAYDVLHLPALAFKPLAIDIHRKNHRMFLHSHTALCRAFPCCAYFLPTGDISVSILP